MERTQLFDLMGELEALPRHEGRFRRDHHGDRCQTPARTSTHCWRSAQRRDQREKQARSIKYQLTIAKLPLAKDLEDFQFEGTPINQTLVTLISCRRRLHRPAT